MRTLIFFLDRRALSLFLPRLAAALAIRTAPHRVVAGGRLVGDVASAPPPPPPPPPPSKSPPRRSFLVDLGGRPAQAGADLVGDDLDLRALLAVLGLPRALLEAAGHDDAGALLRPTRPRSRPVCCQQVTSKKETASSHSLVWRFCQRRLTARPKVAIGLPAGGEAQLGVAGDVADDGDGVVRCHVEVSSPTRRSAGAGSPEQAAAGGLLVGQADQLVADDLVREAERRARARRGRAPRSTISRTT